MSGRFADFLWRWRFPLSAIIVICAIGFVPRANITQIDNDISAWFSASDPVYRDYERFRDEFGGSRTLIIALQAESSDRLFSREMLDFVTQLTGDIERVDTVERVASLATATTVEATDEGGESGLDVRRLIDPAPPASDSARATARSRRSGFAAKADTKAPKITKITKQLCGLCERCELCVGA